MAFLLLMSSTLSAQNTACLLVEQQLPEIQKMAEEGHWEKALRQCLTLQGGCPEHRELLLMKSDLYLKLDEPDSSEKQLRNYLKLYPSEGIGYRKMAGWYYYLGDEDSSLFYLDRAIQLDRKDTTAIYNKGEIYYGQENFDAAEKQFLLVLSIVPDHVAARLRICDIALASNQPKKCREQIEVLQIKHAQNLDVMLTEAMLLIAEQHFDRAAVVLDNAQRVDSTEKSVYFTRARLYEKTNKLLQALEQYNRLNLMDADDAAVYLERGNLLQEMEQFELAIKDYEDVLSIDSSYHEAWHQKGIAHYELSNFDLALVALSEYLRREPEDAEAWFNRGNIKYALLDYSGALEDYNRALELEDQPDFRYNRAICQYALNNPSAAIRDLNSYLLKESGDAEAYYLRCLCYLEIQQFEDGCTDCYLARQYGKTDIPKNITKVCSKKYGKKRKK